MFWRHATWSWPRGDDAGYMLAAEPWRTPDSGTDAVQDRAAGTTDPSGPEETNDTGDLSTPHASHVTADAKTQVMVSVSRGKDGFGFTICCNSPVRVQSVDTGGPAHGSGLRGGDAVLQLNGLPVETWKCGDLAHAIRSCPSQIVLVVWRGSPDSRTGCESLLRPLAPTKTLAVSETTKLLHQLGSTGGSTLGVLGSLWRDCKDHEGHCTSTLKGTRVTSSSGDNYIILSPTGPEEERRSQEPTTKTGPSGQPRLRLPLPPGAPSVSLAQSDDCISKKNICAPFQLLHPVLDDGTRTMGHPYQTHPRTGLNRFTLAAPPSSTLRNYGNYQNCTIIQSRVPSCSGALAPLAPIFPVSVQDAELTNHLRKENKSLAADVWSGFAFLRRRKHWVQCDSLERALRNTRPSAGEVLKWAESLEALLANQYGLAVFRHFLKSELSEENLDFWSAVERFKGTRSLSKMAARATKIYEEFVSSGAPRQVNMDSKVRDSTNHSLRLGVHPASFQLAQDQIFHLMEADSYPRFLKSHLYAQLANQDTRVGHRSQAPSAQPSYQNRSAEPDGQDF
uniref:regulator of G-protein signaling 3-like isoform X2 n=1 Tax=Doryrhamphus excisus TaxID=161450 RepID=UPI0025AE1804|nr:regulator of G-protein signaling 3-like isoform X2 [Doryrhamphus excisus]